MRKIVFLAFVATAVTLFTQCRSTRSASQQQKLSYAAHIQPIMAEKCTPCHFPDKGGKVEALNNYAAVKGHIDDIIRRIQLNPGERGFMPLKKPKLSDSTINVFKQWKEEGMAE